MITALLKFFVDILKPTFVSSNFSGSLDLKKEKGCSDAFKGILERLVVFLFEFPSDQPSKEVVQGSI